MEVKSCSACKEQKTFESFNRNASKKDGRSCVCRQCQKVYKDQHYSKNSAQVKADVKDRKASLRQWFVERRSNMSCMKCGFSHPAALDFHHRESADKESHVSLMVARGVSIERIEAEIAKCDVLCSNCHRILHYEERLERAVGFEPTTFSLEN